MKNGESLGARPAHAADLVRPRAANWRALSPEDYTARLYPRKAWEFEFIAAAAEELGLLDGNKVALGIGTEPLIFFFARHARRVVASDLHSPQAALSTARIDNVERVFEASANSKLSRNRRNQYCGPSASRRAALLHWQEQYRC